MVKLRITHNPDSINTDLESVIYFSRHEDTNYVLVALTTDLDERTMERYTGMASSLDLRYPDNRILSIQNITIEDDMINFSYRKDSFSLKLGYEHPITVLNEFILNSDIVSILRQAGL